MESIDLDTIVNGKLHCVVAFDWGEEVNLELAAKLVPSEVGTLPRRRRTPMNVGYRPAPLRFNLGSTPLGLSVLGETVAEAEAVVFDFGAVNVALRVAFSLPMHALRTLAADLAEPDWLVRHAKSAVAPLFEKLALAVKERNWNDLYEEYFIFQLDPGENLPLSSELIARGAIWLAGLLRLEDGVLSDEEVQESLQRRISYHPEDVVLVEWGAAVVVDRDCDETLHTLEFANLQLLEYRLIDQRVGDALVNAQRYIANARTWLPFWRTYSRPLRVLNEMRIDAVGTFERTTSALLLVGDQYIARVYRLIAGRLRLDEWTSNLRRSLDVTEAVHETLSSQSAMYRLEFLEIVVVLLILFEIVMSLIGS